MIVQCPQCSKRFDVQEHILRPSGKKLKCSQCKGIFFQAPPAPPPPASPGQGDDLNDFATDTVFGFLDAEPPPPEAPTAKKSAPKAGDETVLNPELDSDDFGLDSDDQTHLSEDELRSLMGDGDSSQWGEEDALSEELGISNETLLALEQEEAKLAVPEEKPARKPASNPDKTMLAVLEEAYPEEDNFRADGDSFAAEEVDPSFDELPTLIAAQVSAKKTPPKESKPAAKPQKQTPIEPDFDSLIEELDQNRELDEVDLDADTHVAAKSNQQLPIGLSGDEEEALASLGFNPGLSDAEEEALGNLGFRGDVDMTPLSDDEDEDLVPARARNPEPPPLTTRKGAFPARSKRPLAPMVWGAVLLLATILVFSVFYTRTGFREWLEYKRYDLDSPFRIVSLESRWIEKEYGQILLVEGQIRNTTSLAHTVPIVHIKLLDKDNQPVAETAVVPGRLLGEKELEGSQETLRAIIQMQGDIKRIKPQKLFPKRDLTLHGIFINPPENADRFQTEFEYQNTETSRGGGAKTFQTIF